MNSGRVLRDKGIPRPVYAILNILVYTLYGTALLLPVAGIGALLEKQYLMGFILVCISIACSLVARWADRHLKITQK